MKRILLILCLLLLSGCAARETPEETEASIPPITDPIVTETPTEPAETAAPDPIRELLDEMSLEQRVGQLFLARCDDVYALEHLKDYHLGGFLLFGRDFRDQTPDSLRNKLSAYQAASALPLLIGVDEEGGTVTRVSSNPAFRATKFPSPRQLYLNGGMELVLSQENEKCTLRSRCILLIYLPRYSIRLWTVPVLPVVVFA